jgi:hypothetical protein
MEKKYLQGLETRQTRLEPRCHHWMHHYPLSAKMVVVVAVHAIYV